MKIPGRGDEVEWALLRLAWLPKIHEFDGLHIRGARLQFKLLYHVSNPAKGLISIVVCVRVLCYCPSIGQTNSSNSDTFFYKSGSSSPGGFQAPS